MASEFVAMHGRDPGIHEAIVLKVAARAEARAMLHERLLSDEWDDLTHEQRTTSLSAIGAAGDQLIRCSKEAGLNKRPDGADLQQRLKLIRAKASAQASHDPPASNATQDDQIAAPEAGDVIASQPDGDASQQTQGDGVQQTEVMMGDGQSKVPPADPPDSPDYATDTRGS
jgi:hypothetical protein